MIIRDRNTMYNGGCGTVLVCLLLLWVLLTLCGCRTVRQSESYVERQRIESMMSRMDSVMRQKTVVQQDSSWRETVIRQLQSIRERNDTSHTVVVDTAGKVIKEKTVIYRDREVVSESDRQEREVLMHRLESMDSTLSVMRSRMERSDSLLQASSKETVVEKKEPWYRKLITVLVCIAIGIALGFTEGFWKKFVKK